MTKQLIDRDEVMKVIQDMHLFHPEQLRIRWPLEAKIISLPIQQSNELNRPTIISWWFQPDGWIDVRERLPDSKWTYLVYDWDNVNSCNFDDNNKFVIYNDWYEYFQNVTHYQPLPNPPITNN